MINIDTAGLRRSPRILAQDERPKRLKFFTILCLVTNVASTSVSVIKNTSSYATRTISYMEEVNRNVDGTPNLTHPFAFAISLADNESYSLKEALKQEDAADFIKTMLKEVDAHEKTNHSKLMKRSDIGRNKTILSTWSFKRKRYQNEEINRHKARLCAHGGIKQWGINYWETYAPVVSCISVRVLLAIVIIHGLPTRSIDFILAFA